MKKKPKASVVSIAIQRPASLRKFLPKTAEKVTLLSSYLIGPENASLSFLFEDSTLSRLEDFSPIVLYGQSESGKSSLAVTLASQWSRIHSARPLCLTSGEQFSSQFTASLEIDDVDSFRRRHRGCKLLLMDELESLTSAKATQIELSATIDALAESSKPIILTSKLLPASTSGLTPRLVSRLSGGTSLEVSQPSMETGIAIAIALAKEMAPSCVEKDIVNLVQRLSEEEITAMRIRSLVINAAANVDGSGRVNIDRALQQAQDSLHASSLTMKDIAKLVARRMNVRLTDLRGSTRQASIVRARGLATLLIRDFTNHSLQDIGGFLGGRDHSTILHAYNKTRKLLDTDAEIASLHAQLLGELP